MVIAVLSGLLLQKVNNMNEEKGFKNFIKLVLEVFFKSTKDTSGPISLDKIDYAKLSRNALIYGSGASVAYVIQYIAGADFGAYTPIVGAILGGLLDALRKALKNNLL